MKRLASILTLAFACAAFGESAIDEANADFQAGAYEKAAAGYERAVASGPASAELFYNLGNALDRAGKPVEASLNYERALLLDPGLREARNNRALLAAARNIPQPPHRWQDDVARLVHPETLAIAGTVLGWLGLFGIGFVIFSTRRQNAATGISVAAFVLGTALFAIGWMADPRNADADVAIVTSKDGVDLLSAPAKNSTPLATLPAGSPLGVLSPQGAWTYCALASGAKGWVRTDSITPVVPGVKFPPAS